MLKYTHGDATYPEGSGHKTIVHCCNDRGGWGRGFVMAVSKRWAEPEKQYRQWVASCSDEADKKLLLGFTQFVTVADDIIVANMMCQHGYTNKTGIALRYGHLAMCLQDVRLALDSDQGPPRTVHMPRIGAGLAGGDWEIIESIIDDILVSHGVDVTVYDLP